MTPEDYLALPYTLTLTPDHDDRGNTGFVAKVAELPGCNAQGETEAEALDNLRDAMAAWLEVAQAEGMQIPMPKEESHYGGRVLLRLPVSLHAELARAAEAEGTSLNQFLVGALAGAVGWRAGSASQEPQWWDEVISYGSRRRKGGAKILYYSPSKSALVDNLKIDALPIKRHSIMALKGAGVETVGELAAKKPEDLTSIRSFGEKSLFEVQRSLELFGLKLPGSK